MNRICIIFLLIIFSTLDAVLTDIGLRNHLIEEANVLIKFVYDHGLIWFYIIKVGLPCLLLLIIPLLKKRWYTSGLLSVSLLVYLGVMGIHYYWISSLSL